MPVLLGPAGAVPGRLLLTVQLVQSFRRTSPPGLAQSQPLQGQDGGLDPAQIELQRLNYSLQLCSIHNDAYSTISC